MKTRKVLVVLICITIILVGCSDDDTPEVTFSTETFEGTGMINPANFPAGVGLDLSAGDTGRVAQLDAEAGLDWDLMILTYRTSQGGRPGIFLFGDQTVTDAAEGLDISAAATEVGTGAGAFTSFTNVTSAMQSALTTDGVFDFDPETDVDDSGMSDLDLLLAAYENLVIGNAVINLEESDQPVFLIRSKEGDLYKFQFVQLEMGGTINLRWARFATDAIE